MENIHKTVIQMHMQCNINEMTLQTLRNGLHFPAPGMSNWEIKHRKLITQVISVTCEVTDIFLE